MKERVALTILLTGGGTGGHITPLLAVAHELKKIRPECHLVYVGERNGKYASMLDDNGDIDEIYQIFAGKFRRYHGESWLTRLTDFNTLLLNIRDLVFLIIGIFQSIYMVRKINPSIVFLKGGFVGVPIGLSCALWRKPFITHDSDALPGLANRIVGRWAKYHATAMPPSYYSYKPEDVKHVGVLVGPEYKFIDKKLQLEYRRRLNIPHDAKVLMITGGSGGAAVINAAIASGMQNALEKNEKLHVIHQVGIGKSEVYDGYSNNRLQVHELLKDLYLYSGAADIIVTRAGANTLAEFGVQAKACIVVPNPLLTGGHQLINAKHLEENEAAIIVDEAQLHDAKQRGTLWVAINNLMTDEAVAKSLSGNLHRITLKNASLEISQLLIDTAKGDG